jgi:hypothetical protein
MKFISYIWKLTMSADYQSHKGARGQPKNIAVTALPHSFSHDSIENCVNWSVSIDLRTRPNAETRVSDIGGGYFPSKTPSNCHNTILFDVLIDPRMIYAILTEILRIRIFVCFSSAEGIIFLNFYLFSVYLSSTLSGAARGKKTAATGAGQLDV